MKIKAQPKLHISLSKEHGKYQPDVTEAFKGLDVSFDAGLMRFSAEEMAMQVILNIGLGVASSAVWDAIKLGIKKLHKNFKTVRITLRDSDSIMYTVKPDSSVVVLAVPDRMKEFEHIKNVDDLIRHLKRKTDPTIPAGWKRVTLGDLFEFKNGLNSEKENFGHGVRFINIMEILKHDFLVAENIPGRINVDQKRNKENIVEYGDVLFNRTSETPDEVGMTSVYLDTEPVVFGGFVIRAKPKSNELNDLFKKYCFSSEMFRKEVIKQGQGVVRGNIGQSNLRVIPFLLPPKDEQARIVSVLETANGIIQKLELKIEAKEQIKKGLMQGLLTGEKKLTGFNGEWKVLKLKTICNIQKGEQLNKSNMIKDGNYPALNGGIEASGYTDKWNTKENTITISEGGNSCGYVNFNTEKFWCGGHCYSVVPNKETDNLFLYQALKIRQDKLMQLRVGSGLPNVQKSALDNFKIKIPIDIKEQIAISNILTISDTQIDQLKKKLLILKEQKRYLLNNLITGKIRTPETLSTKLTK